jgi:rubrerythrin
MPNFANPFQGNVNRKISKAELIQAIRLDIAGELEAIYIYDAHVQATDDPLAQKVISDIRDEEKAHVGELMTLLRTLDPEEAAHFASGEGEVKEMLEALGITQTTASQPEKTVTSPNPASTVGSLIKE